MKGANVLMRGRLLPAFTALWLAMAFIIPSPVCAADSAETRPSGRSLSGGLDVELSVCNATGYNITAALPGAQLEIIAVVSSDTDMNGIFLTCTIDGRQYNLSAGPFDVSLTTNARRNWSWVPNVTGDPILKVEAVCSRGDACATMMFSVNDYPVEVGPCYMGWDNPDSSDFLVGIDEFVMAPEIENACDHPVNTTTSFWLNNDTLLLEQALEVPAGRSANVTLRTNLSGYNLSAGRCFINASVFPGGEGCGMGFDIIIPVPGIRLVDFSVPDGIRAGDTVEFCVTVVDEGLVNATGLWVQFYDGMNKTGWPVYFDLGAGCSTSVRADVEIRKPVNADHFFRARLYRQELNLTRRVGTGPIGLIGIDATVGHRSSNGGYTYATLSVNVTLLNRGSVPGRVNLSLKDGGVYVTVRPGIAVPAFAQTNVTIVCRLKGTGFHNVSAELEGADADAMSSNIWTYVKIPEMGTPALKLKGCVTFGLVAVIIFPAILFRGRDSKKGDGGRGEERVSRMPGMGELASREAGKPVGEPESRYPEKQRSSSPQQPAGWLRSR